MDRRSFLAVPLAVAGVTAVGASLSLGVGGRVLREGGNSGFELMWLGVNGWVVRFGGVKLLVDPWVSRYFTGTFSEGGQDPTTEVSWDRGLIASSFQEGFDAILLTHGHFDHISDVPLVAIETGATIWGSESHLNLVRSLAARAAVAVPEGQFSLLCGGEVRDFGSFTVEVLRSVHRPFGGRQVAGTAGSKWEVDSEICQIGELVEGGSLSYVITSELGSSLMILGSADFSGSDLPAQCPDIVVFPTGGASVGAAVRRFADRIGQPMVVIASHWDNFDLPLVPPVDVGNVAALSEAVAMHMPRAQFLVPAPLEPFVP